MVHYDENLQTSPESPQSDVQAVEERYNIALAAALFDLQHILMNTSRSTQSTTTPVLSMTG